MQKFGTIRNKISTITTMVNDQTTQDNIANAAIDPKSVLVETSANTMDGPASQQPSESQHVYAQQVSNSPPMAVLPLNPSAKLDQEPNPFEQSFSSASKTSPGAEKIKLPPGPTTSTTTTASSTTASTGSVSSTNSVHSMTVTSNPTTNEPLKLPPVAAMTSPAGASVMSSVPKDIASQYAWDSLRAGPLSPSMLQRPNNPDDSAYSNINPSSSLLSYQEYPPNSYQVKTEPYYPHERTQTATTKYHSKQPPQKPSKRSTINKKNTTTNNTFSNSINTTTNGVKVTSPASPVSPSQRKKLPMDDYDDKDDRRNDGDDMDDDGEKVAKKARTGEEDEKRKNFLERNRLAALKCRQRKKQWLNNLQAKVEYLTNDNEQLQIQTNSLRDEIMNLKTLLLAHKDCPMSQANNNGLPASVNPKTMGAPPPSHQQQQPSLLHTTGGTNGTSVVSTMPAATNSSATMAPMYAPRPFNNQSSSPSANHHPHHHQHRLSTSSTGSQPPSGALNMVMVSQHQVTAPQSSTVSSSSGVLQF